VAIELECPPGLSSVTIVYLIQHGEKERLPGDPGLTLLGRQQAAATGAWLHGESVGALYASPLRRAWETAETIASATGLSVHRDARLRERLNWDGRQPFGAFLAVWAETARDRDLLPAGGESSRQAAARLQGFLADLRGRSGPVAAVTHGGVTTELLRSLLGDGALPPWVLDSGIPPCAVTTVRDLTVIAIGDAAHLR
jgi:broad specificity phosphatase PhoE